MDLSPMHDVIIAVVKLVISWKPRGFQLRESKLSPQCDVIIAVVKLVISWKPRGFQLRESILSPQCDVIISHMYQNMSHMQPHIYICGSYLHKGGNT